MLGISLYTISATREIILTSTEEKLHMINDLKIAQLEGLFDGDHGEVKTLFEQYQDNTSFKTNIDTIHRLHHKISSMSRERQTIFRQFQTVMVPKQLQVNKSLFPDVSRIAIFDLKGNKLVESESLPAHEEHDKAFFKPDNEFFKYGQKRLTISPVYVLNEKSDQPEYRFDALGPMQNNKGAKICVMAITFDMKNIYKSLYDTTGLRFGQSGETFLTQKTDKNTVLIISKNKSNSKNVFGPSIRLNNDDDLAFGTIKSITPKAHGFASEVLDYQGNIVDVAWDYLPGYEWGIVSKIDHNESFAELDLFIANVRLICFFIIFFSILLITVFVQWFLTPIIRIRNNMVQLSIGKFPEKIEYKFNDEIRETTNALNFLVDRLQTSTNFAERIGKGELDAQFESNQKDVLSKSLISMQQSLSKIEEENERRKWVTEGIAIHGEVLRRNSNNIQALGKSLIASLAKYVNAQHGMIYAVNFDNDADKKKSTVAQKFYELVGTYAYETEDLNKSRFLPGQGLVGQCALERETIYLEKAPSDFTQITSGLGDGEVPFLLIVPLKIHEEVYGVLELAKFSPFEDYKRDFIERLGESIASSILSVRSNEKTTDTINNLRVNNESLLKDLKELKRQLGKSEKEIVKLKKEIERQQNAEE